MSTSLWSFVRYLSKKKARKGPKPVVVLRTPQGGIANTPEELAKIWQDTFFREIDRRGEIIPASDYVPFASQMLDTITPPPDVNAPCLLDIYSSTVDAISRVATGRATGPDLIPAELLKAGGSSLCLLLARLFSKVGGHRAPLAWRWGENVPVPKESDKPLTPDTARGVLLGNAIAKLWAKMIRTELAPHFALQSFAQQLGPSTGGGTHFATQAVKLHMHKTSILKKCGAVVFADLKAAFYRTVLEYVLGGLSDVESTEKLSRKLGLSPQLALQLRASAAQGTEYLLSIGVPSFWARAAADWHRCAAFHVPGSPDMVVTHAGTKPGDPLADLIFCIAFFQYQQELQQTLSDEGLLIHLPKPGPSLLEPCDDLTESVPFGTPAFFDDFFVPLVNDAPAGLLEDIQKTVACLISVGHRFGISINTSEGKTEAMIHLVGPTAKDTLSTLFTTRPPDAPRHLLGLLEFSQGQHIGLVSSYKHLGVKAAPTMQSQRAQECQHRAASARQAFRALSARVFASGRISKKDRTLVASTCIVTRALHGAGAWEEHTDSSRKTISAAYMAPFRRIVGTRFDLGEPPLSDLAVCQKLGIPTLNIAQAVHRLLYLARVLQHGPDWLWSLIQSHAGKQWRECVFSDLEFMAAVLRDKLADLGDPRGHWQRWQTFILGFPAVWKRLVKSFSAVARSPHQQVPSSTASWPCYECGMTFKTSKALACHQARSHQKERVSGRYVRDGNCPFCGAFFHTRVRAMHHVDFGSKTCKARLLSSPGLPELTEEEIALARQQDRLDYASARARGVWRNTGPPACPPPGGWTRPKTQCP